MRHADGMLLAEELLLAGLDPDRGKVVNWAGQQLGVGLAGAVIAELGLAGQVAVVGKRFATSGPPPVDPVLRDAYDALGEGRGRRTKDQLRRLDRAVGGLRSRLVDHLVEQGILGRRTRRILLFPVTRHPVTQPGVRDEVVARLRTAAAGTGELEPRTAALLALAGPCRLLEVVAPERGLRRHARARIAAATQLTPVAPVVRAVIQETQAAVAAGGAAAG